MGGARPARRNAPTPDAVQGCRQSLIISGFGEEKYRSSWLAWPRAAGDERHYPVGGQDELARAALAAHLVRAVETPSIAEQFGDFRIEEVERQVGVMVDDTVGDGLRLGLGNDEAGDAGERFEFEGWSRRATPSRLGWPNEVRGGLYAAVCTLAGTGEDLVVWPA